ncbi:hypothetical protein FRC11_008082, partial [Ceratobasidium sp. 423]
MSTEEFPIRNNVIYCDHEPSEIPSLPTKRLQKRAKVPSVQHFKRFEGEAPKLSRDRVADFVDDYYPQFYCPLCYLWRTSGESRAVNHCGHVFCVTCWDSWARASGKGPENNRLTSCPTCRVDVRHSATREVDFRASRFNSDTVVVERLSETISKLR